MQQNYIFFCLFSWNVILGFVDKSCVKIKISKNV